MSNIPPPRPSRRSNSSENLRESGQNPSTTAMYTARAVPVLPSIQIQSPSGSRNAAAVPQRSPTSIGAHQRRRMSSSRFKLPPVPAPNRPLPSRPVRPMPLPRDAPPPLPSRDHVVRALRLPSRRAPSLPPREPTDSPQMRAPAIPPTDASQTKPPVIPPREPTNASQNNVSNSSQMRAPVIPPQEPTNASQNNASSSNNPNPTLLSAPPVKKEKRQYTIDEIISTEQTYVNGLHVLIESFLIPMRKNSKFSSSQLETLFCNVESLLAFHSVFVRELEKSVEEKKPITDPIMKLLPFLKIYTVYINNYPECQVLSGALFESHAKEIEPLGEGSLTGSMGLSLLLGTPVQRIPRYVMLLRDLVKRTDKDHPDYEKLVHAYEAVSVMAQHINARKAAAESRLRLREIDHSLSGIADSKSARASLMDSVSDINSMVESSASSTLGAPSMFRAASSASSTLTHQWKKVYFSKPTWCDVCRKFIFGITKKQGYQCAQCRTNVHSKCRMSGGSCLGQPVDDKSQDNMNEKGVPSLVRPHRKFIGEEQFKFVRIDKRATLTGLGEQLHRNPKKCMIFLFNDAILVTEASSSKSLSVHSESLEFVAFMRWFSRRTTRQARIQRLGEKSFSVEGPRNPGVVYQFFAHDSAQADEWYEKMSKECKEWNEQSVEVAAARRLSSSNLTPLVDDAGYVEQHVNDAATSSKRLSTNQCGGSMLLNAQSSSGAVSLSFLSCARFNFHVPSAVRVAEKPPRSGYFTAYLIEISDAGEHVTDETTTKTIIRRFSQLWDLKHTIKKRVSTTEYQSLSKFPPKRWFDNTNPTLVQQRCRQIERWLNSLNKLPNIFERSYMKAFLKEESTFEVELASANQSNVTLNKAASGTAVVDTWSSDSSDDDHQMTVKIDGQQEDFQRMDTIDDSHTMLIRETVDYVCALYDFKAENEGELDVCAGDHIEVLDNSDEQWLYGKHQGTVGYIPKSYVISEVPFFESSSEPPSFNPPPLSQ